MPPIFRDTAWRSLQRRMGVFGSWGSSHYSASDESRPIDDVAPRPLVFQERRFQSTWRQSLLRQDEQWRGRQVAGHQYCDNCRSKIDRLCIGPRECSMKVIHATELHAPVEGCRIQAPRLHAGAAGPQLDGWITCYL